jgi:hypothetical protein
MMSVLMEEATKFIEDDYPGAKVIQARRTVEPVTFNPAVEIKFELGGETRQETIPLFLIEDEG